MYAISSAVFNHANLLDRLLDDGTPPLQIRFDRPYDLPVDSASDLRQLSAQIVRDAGLSGSYSVNRPNPRQIVVTVRTFRSLDRLTYFPEQKRLLAEHRVFRWDRFLTSIHQRSGYGRPLLLDTIWAIVVDIVAAGFLVWLLSGLWIWWCQREARRWGVAAMAAGGCLFTLLLLGL
jgi:hypothetical protein